MTLPTVGLRLRLFIIAFGVVLMIWFSLEDQVTWHVTLLGTILASLIMISWLLNQLGGQTIEGRFIVIGALLLGSIIGAGTSLATVGLMFFKNSWHAHPYPDFPTGLMLAILARAPFWALAGGLFGLAVAFLLHLRDHQPKSTKTNDVGSQSINR